MPTKRFGGDDPLEVRNDNALHDFDQQVYGTLNIPDRGHIVAKPIDVFSVRPDIQQPRRILPMAVREDWNGDPAGVPVVLRRWLEYVNHVIGMKLPIKQVLLGEWESTLTDAQKNEPIVWSFFDIAGLAITIAEIGQREAVEYAEGVLIDGERRWWATHMLNTWAGKVAGRDFSKILAAEKPKPDVWAQATRNGARTQLNAVEMARQVALLIMAMYEGDPGVSFNSFKQLVLPGSSDRAFYAQVANGNVYRIKRGMTEKVMAATGLKSDSAVRNYRSLLNIPDALWVKADEQNWTEYQIREYLQAVNGASQAVTEVESVTSVTVSGSDQVAVEGNVIPQTERVRGASGLYVDRPVKPATPPKPTPAPQNQRAVVRADYDDDWDDDDIEYIDDEGTDTAGRYWPEDDEPVRPLESTTAILATWDANGHKVRPVLELLKAAAADPAAKLKLSEMLTLSPADIAQHLQGTRGGWWDTYIQECIAVIEPLLIKHVQTALYDYLMHVKQEGDYLRDKYQRG